MASLRAAKGFDFTHMQALGGNKGKEAMEEAGFEEVTVTPESVAFYVTPAFGYREFFAYMASCTPADVRIAVRPQIWDVYIYEELHVLRWRYAPWLL